MMTCGRFVELDRLARDVGVAVDRFVQRPRTETEAAHDLAGMQRLRGTGHDAGLVEIDDPVGEHLGVDAEVAHAALQQQRAHGIRHRADADLQTRAVFDLAGDQSRHGTVGISRCRVRQLGHRLTVTFDDVVDLADVEAVLDAVHVRQRVVHLDDDDLGPRRDRTDARGWRRRS